MLHVSVAQFEIKHGAKCVPSISGKSTGIEIYFTYQVGIINNTPTAAELEEKAKAGGQISLAEYAEALKAEKKQTEPEKKPSIRAQLRADKEKTAQKKAAKTKNHELEV